MGKCGPWLILSDIFGYCRLGKKNFGSCKDFFVGPCIGIFL
jgi:hypothetical protein